MPSLDDLKKRIKSVKSTQKITKAMKMVAAAKLRKAQESAEKGRPYSQKMQNIILNLTKSINDPQNAPKLLVGTGEDKKYLCVVLTADRGLCGGFNSNICKLAKTNFKKIEHNKDKFITTGLWKYSRHPNYLGEIILWTGVAIISYSSLEVYQMFTLVSPIFTYLLLVNVSGINLLEKSGEKKWGHLDSYKSYKENTPRLIGFL